ncbi:MAG: hypothetical protein ABSA91_08480 [Acidimicrobiales bacterium]|jgi:hypothetical protein
MTAPGRLLPDRCDPPAERLGELAPPTSSVKGPFQVVLVQPEGYVHSAAFAEVIESVVCGLRALGADVCQTVNQLVPGRQPIVFGANLLGAATVDVLPRGTIIYNLEQIGESSSWCSPTYLSLLQSCQVWDYSARNIASLARLGVTAKVKHVPVGYVPELTRIKAAPVEDIDVLFYGSMNDRRNNVISQLRQGGLNAHAVFGVYGPSRDTLIARSKVVLSMHYYETNIFELVRVSYLLANRKAVVAECNPGTEIDPDIVDAVQLAPYEGLVSACAQLVADSLSRKELSERGFSRMVARDERAYLAAAFEPKD